jgi:tetratricopeptide (TPR) repeat protein
MAQAVGTFARTLSTVLAIALAVANASVRADDFLRCALIAGGASDAAEAAKWETVYERAQREILTNELLALASPTRPFAIQRGLHERLLTGKYQAAASDLRVVLARGDYNCLSAVALCYDLCCRANVELEIWSRPGHVWLQTSDGAVIEAVNRPPPALQTSMRGTTPSRKITPQELLGKFYYNRGVQLLQEQRYAEGLKCVQQAVALDPHDADARENLLAGLNNWAAEHLRARRYDEAAKLLRQGLAIEPAYGPLVSNSRLLPAQSGR